MTDLTHNSSKNYKHCSHKSWNTICSPRSRRILAFPQDFGVEVTNHLQFLLLLRFKLFIPFNVKRCRWKNFTGNEFIRFTLSSSKTPTLATKHLQIVLLPGGSNMRTLNLNTQAFGIVYCEIATKIVLKRYSLLQQVVPIAYYVSISRIKKGNRFWKIQMFLDDLCCSRYCYSFGWLKHEVEPYILQCDSELATSYLFINAWNNIWSKQANTQVSEYPTLNYLTLN